MQIEIKNLSKKFRKNQVLKSVTFTAKAGECVGILGGNGSGKSTMLSILAGVQNADGGEFICDGVNLFKNKARRSKLVGYVPQGTPLIEELTARDNLLLWYDKKTMERELENGVLKLLGVGDFLKIPVNKMSGGMRKRLSIGCAMQAQPPVLLLDEPTAALDLACKQSIAQWLRKYKADGGIILLTTHDIMELDLCDRWFIIRDGALVPFEYDGDPEKLVRSL